MYINNLQKVLCKQTLDEKTKLLDDRYNKLFDISFVFWYVRSTGLAVPIMSIPYDNYRFTLNM